MKILMVSSEATPYAKTGGLADVLGALPQALVRLGDEVAVVLPKYLSVRAPSARRIVHSLALNIGPHRYMAAIDEDVVEGVRYFLLDCPPLYHRDSIYPMEGDDHIRFAALTHAAIALGRQVFRPDVFNAHDWHAGLLAPLLKIGLASDPAFMRARSVLTIHNLAYQGNFPEEVIEDLGLDRSMYHPEGLEFWDQVSFMKAGIVWSDAINTVSPTYAREIQTPEFGCGMDHLLRARSSKLSGILNGVDYSVWNPATDRHLPARYSPQDLEGKKACKRALLKELKLDEKPERPVVGIVSRLAEQKGFDLIDSIGSWLAQQDMAMAVLGSGDPQIEKMFRDLAAAQPGKFGIGIGYNDPLAHRIEAGSDLFLMPSRYEPCGLNQIYSLKYATPPIVRATGGLDDTVDATTGFKFHAYSPAALAVTIDEALAEYRQRDRWTDRMLRGMSRDFSWDESAKAYQRLFQSL